jgi:hypothetical protein
MRSIHLLFISGYLNKMNASKIIKNIDIPSCKNCIYFKRSGYIPESLSRCDKFGEKNIITDEIKYDFADYCRNDEKKCGIEGRYFIKETDLNLRINDIKTQLNENSTVILLISVGLLYLIMTIYTVKLNT